VGSGGIALNMVGFQSLA